MTYPQTLTYLYSRLPMFQRIGAAAYKDNLDNTIAICKALGNPEKKIKCVHIAGTNGKGSSSHMLAAVLQKAGYKTGLYTSPHLIDFRERIKINGKQISKNDVVKFVEDYKNIFEEIEPSFFEWTVGLAFYHFAQQEVDIAIIEVGLGGRLDSTNVIKPECSLITNISFDHVKLLGNTLPLIASEKAGIIKEKIPVVISQTQLEVLSIFNLKAQSLKAPIIFADKIYKIISQSYQQNELSVELFDKENNIRQTFKLDLTGQYQIKNLIGILAILEILKKKGFLIENAKVIEALTQVKKLTGLLGRWQTISEKPLIIADTAHNEDGMKEVLKNFERYTYKKLHIVIGVVNDKDHHTLLNLLPKTAIYYFCKANIPRALSEEELYVIAKNFGLNGKKYPTVKDALNAAKKQATTKDLIFIGGSTFTVADALC
ncbi:MAG: bifunctional folylpolyglutamate synthase/dihydrofolate synthase [Bacteroidota bacterium]|jgi:dihydrofolate synthase/folylpolyglutamate synthase